MTSRRAQSMAAAQDACRDAQQLLRADLPAAAARIESALAAAKRLRDPALLAEALRLRAHVDYLSGRYGKASQAYRRAIQYARQAHDEEALGRTLSSGLQTLVYLGRYAEAEEWARQAREIFERSGDRLRLARLESNLANVLHRQDRAEEALPLYESAYTSLQRLGDEDNAAIALRNLAVCAMAVYDFPRSFTAYREAQAYYERKGQTALAAEVTDNLAYLHYLRGDYAQAIHLYQSARERVRERANPFYQGVAELDQSDLYLDLNLFLEARQNAESAYARFVSLGTRYEAGKALANQAAALGALGDTPRALEVLGEARRLFLRERNRHWAAITGIRRASLLLLAGQPRSAAAAAARAEREIGEHVLTSQLALAALLQARAALLQRQPHAAEAHALRARRYLHRTPNALLETRLLQTEGEIYESRGQPTQALDSFREAHLKIRNARHALPHDRIKLAYLGDKLFTYEALTELTLRQGGPQAAHRAFAYIEEAKSRSLADQLAFRAAAPPRENQSGAYIEASRIALLRAELAWHWHQIDRGESQREPLPESRRLQISRRIDQLEQELTVALTTLRRVDADLADLQGFGDVPAGLVQSSLPEGSALFEYYAARGTLYLFVLTRDQLQVRSLGPVAAVYSAVRMLRFHLARTADPSTFQAAHPAIDRHLARLSQLLLAPAGDLLPARHLVIVPHGELHGLPFHAMPCRGQPLVDDLLITYSLSAAVHYRTSLRPPRAQGPALLLGVPDRQAPLIREEVRAIGQVLPQARTFLDEDATTSVLRTLGPQSRYIHIATHGLFRRDNPMFSSVRLGDGRLNVADLYELHLPADLVTLSGCFTGLGASVAGDEFVGLSRGFLHAGARRLLVSLWAVQDRSSPPFMQDFYGRLAAGAGPVESWRDALLALRRQYPHPADWAAFALME